MVALADQADGDGEVEGCAGEDQAAAGEGRLERWAQEQGRGAVGEGRGGHVTGGVVADPWHDRRTRAGRPVLQGHYEQQCQGHEKGHGSGRKPPAVRTCGAAPQGDEDQDGREERDRHLDVAEVGEEAQVVLEDNRALERGSGPG